MKPYDRIVPEFLTENEFAAITAAFLNSVLDSNIQTFQLLCITLNEYERDEQLITRLGCDIDVIMKKLSHMGVYLYALLAAVTERLIEQEPDRIVDFPDPQLTKIEFTAVAFSLSDVLHGNELYMMPLADYLGASIMESEDLTHMYSAKNMNIDDIIRNIMCCTNLYPFMYSLLESVDSFDGGLVVHAPSGLWEHYKRVTNPV